MTQTRPVQIHLDDLDVLGMLHNSRYSLLVERAISAFWAEQGWSIDPAVSRFKDVCVAVREFKITYHAPIAGAGEVLVDFWLDRMGRTSGVYGFSVLSPDRSVRHADGYRVNVNLDPATLRPAPFTSEVRAAAAQLRRTPSLS
ncbi:acyl-CoA thioesterase [Nonomuraea lactucae]|uniref:acyl-CoA thioesterase n=1 Tax=Nonomuraea lactucae TaxID=2249762 RepID=UPI001F059894|nr:hotdog domain-containing protein [Nonomuraea lactucae]